MHDSTSTQERLQELGRRVQELEDTLRQRDASQRFVHDFFLEHATSEKRRRRRNDQSRLARLRELPQYEAAFQQAEPLVTVIVPTLNRADTILERALPSLQAQTYENWELIVVGDAADGAQERLLKQMPDRRARFYNLRRRGCYPEHKGPRWYVAGNKPANFGLKVARGLWIAHLDDDDELTPHHMADLLALARERQAEWVHGNVLFVSDEGYPAEVIGGAEPKLGSISRISSLYHSCLKGFQYNPGAWKYLSPGDWDLWDRFLEMGVRHAHLPQLVGIHYGSRFGVLRAYGYEPALPLTSGTRVDADVGEEDKAENSACDVTYHEAERLLESGDQAGALAVLQRLLETDPHHALAHNDAGVICFQHGELDVARALLQRAHALSPDELLILRNLISVLVELGEYEEARQHVASFVVRNPDDQEAQQLLQALTADEHGSDDSALVASIVIPVFNQVAYTRQCLETLYLVTDDPRGWEVIVVDDASSDETPEFLQEASQRYPNLTVIQNERNLGFSGACNAGAAQARGRQIVFLNNDTLPKPGWLQALVRESADPKVGIVGAKLVFPADPDSGVEYVQHAGIAFGPERNSLHVYKFCLSQQPFVNRTRELQAVTGAAMLVRADLFREAGGFDTAYRNGGEDLDLCFKVRAAGYSVRYCADSVVTHFESVTVRATGQQGHSAADENYRLFLQRWGEHVHVDEASIYQADGLNMPDPAAPRIAMVSPLPPQKSGICYYTRELLPQLAKHAVVDLFADGFATDDPELLSRYRVHDLKHLTYVDWMYHYDQIIYHLGNNKFHAGIYEVAARKPGVVVIHEYDTKGCTDSVTTNKELLEWIVPNAKGVIVHNEHSRRLLASEFPQYPIDVIPLILHDHTDNIRGRDRASEKAALGYRPDDYLVVSLGLVQYHKRNHITVEAFARFAERHPDAQLVLGGEALDKRYLAHLEELIAEHGLQERVRITGWLSDDDFWRYLAACDVSINLRYPARGEESGGLYWGLGSGKPVLVSNYAQFGDLPDDCVVKIDFEDEVGQIAAALERFHSDPAAAVALGERAVAFVQGRNVASRIGQLYFDFAMRVSKREAGARLPTDPARSAEVLLQFPVEDTRHWGRDLALALDRAGIPLRVDSTGSHSVPRHLSDPASDRRLAELRQRPLGSTFLQLYAGPAKAFNREPGAAAALVWADQPDAASVLDQDADRLWVPSEYLRNRLMEQGGIGDRIDVVPFGVAALNYGTTVHEVPVTGDFVFLLPTDFSAASGWEEVLSTFLRTFQARKDVFLRLRLMSDEFDPKLRKQLTDEKLAAFALAHTEFSLEAFQQVLVDREPRNERERPLMYWGVHACICVEPDKAFYRTALEAQAIGLPVVVADAGGQTDFADHTNAFVIPSAGGGKTRKPDRRALTEAMRELVDRRMETGALGIVGRVQALNGRTWDHVAAQVKERLEGLCSTHAEVRWEVGEFGVDAEPAAIAAAEVVAPVVQDMPTGINVIGHISGNLGIGVTARSVIQALLDRGIDVATIDIDPGMGRAGADRSFDHLAVQRFEDLPHAINLFVLPPASIAALHRARPDFFECGHLNVGFSMWELPAVPREWIPALEALDVLVAESEFIRHAFQFSLSGVQVLSASHPLYLPTDVYPQRARFGLPEDGVIFLSSFEPNSDVERKNPEAVVQAFLQGVGQDPRAHLVFKLNNATSNGVLQPSVAALRLHAERHPRIHLLTETLRYEEVLALYASCDVFVSLHRAEGLGLALLECMALGKPVVATGWSGNVSFMDHTCSALVGYDLIPVNGTIPAYQAEMVGDQVRWADPNVDEAAAWLRRLLHDPALRADMGARARAHVERYLAEAERAGFIDELVNLRAQRDFREGGSPAITKPRQQAEMPQSEFERWLETRNVRASEPHWLPELTSDWNREPWFQVVSIMRPGQEALLADTLDSLGAQVYGGWRFTVFSVGAAPDETFAQHPQLEWRRCESEPSLSECLNRVAAQTECEWLLSLPLGDRIDPRALLLFADASQHGQQVQLWYCDEDQTSAEGERSEPAFKPDFNIDLLRSWPYFGDAMVVRRQAVIGLEGYRPFPGAENYDLALRLWQRHGDTALAHLPKLLYHALAAEARGDDLSIVIASGLEAVADHLQRTEPEATVETAALPGTHRVRYPLSQQPLVSIIVPTRNAKALLAACVESLHGQTGYPNFELLVVDNGSDEQDALAYLASLPERFPNTRVLRFAGEYNFSAINNFAVRQARGDYLLLLNNDTRVVHGNWLDELMAQAQRPGVGVVGARLLFPDGKVQHAGVVTGMGANGVAEHPCVGLAHEDAGYLGRAQVVQQVSAVTGACLLVSKSLYQQLGGLDERHLPVMYNDIDLCLKARALGWAVVWTPFATLIHHGSVSLKDRQYTDRERKAREAEIALMLERWPDQLAADPFYNRNLSLKNGGCDVDVEVAAGWDRDRALRPRILGMGFGSDGSWEHRVVAPLQAMEAAGIAETGLLPKYKDRVRAPSVSELLREGPDTLLLHNCVHDVHLEALARYRRHSRAFLVFGQDDLMVQLPASNPFRDKVYKDIKQRLRKAIGLCDRLVVTTEPLADAYRKMAAEIVIQPNYLPASIWGDLSSGRRLDAKPRVGWAGAQQHVGDLALIMDVVKQTAGEIDWVFFGLCFEELLPYVADVVDPVPFARYPETLADLDLDLAVAPLEQNRFNECKSNLKVLEYGAVGIPVVCTDIAPYQSAPVARVANRTADWVAAIRERVADRDALAGEGQRLRQWVHQHWLLEDRLDTWLAALSASELAAAAEAGRS